MSEKQIIFHRGIDSSMIRIENGASTRDEQLGIEREGERGREREGKRMRFLDRGMRYRVKVGRARMRATNGVERDGEERGGEVF